jgi:hypothetical protein
MNVGRWVLQLYAILSKLDVLLNDFLFEMDIFFLQLYSIVIRGLNSLGCCTCIYTWRTNAIFPLMKSARCPIVVVKVKHCRSQGSKPIKR